MNNKRRPCNFLLTFNNRFFTICTKTKQDIEKSIKHKICTVKFNVYCILYMVSKN